MEVEAAAVAADAAAVEGGAEDCNGTERVMEHMAVVFVAQ